LAEESAELVHIQSQLGALPLQSVQDVQMQNEQWQQQSQIVNLFLFLSHRQQNASKWFGEVCKFPQSTYAKALDGLKHNQSGMAFQNRQI